MMKIKGLKAFTLAEVLITLAIIGVVAALTMPTLIQNYQKKATVVKIKKFYSEMNQVFALAKADYGDYSQWQYDNSKDFYLKYIKPYIKNVNKEIYNVHIHGDFDRGVNFKFNDGTMAVFSISSNFVRNSEFVFYTKVNFRPNFLHAKDNTKYPQREIFRFIVNEHGMLLTPHMEKTRDENLNNCKEFNWNAGEGLTGNGFPDCSTVILKDGWEIKDDYPW